MDINVVIVSQAPLTPQTLRDTLLDEYVARNVSAKFWDVSNLIHPGFRCPNEIYRDDKIVISSIENLEKHIERCSMERTVFQFDFDPSWNTNKVFQLFRKYKCRCLRIDMYANTYVHPGVTSIITRFKKLLSESAGKILKKRIERFSFDLYNRVILRFSFNANLSSSVFSQRTHKINHPDYEEYIWGNYRGTQHYPNHILFIDTFYGRHPDLKYFHNVHDVIDTVRYYDSLKRYFDFLEDKYDMPVIIAAHPKSDYATGTFGNRDIIKFQTLPLIKSASYIIAQICNTFSWIALSGKPLMLLANDEYLKSPCTKGELEALGKTFACEVQNIDRINYDETHFDVPSAEKRREYIYSYLTSNETANVRNIDIILEVISKII